MASVPYSEFLGSPQFKFLVGREAQEFTIHSALIARQSEALGALVNGNFREGEERCATWNEVEVDTFIRFSQYAYTGDYEETEPQKLFQPSPVVKNVDTDYDSDFLFEHSKKSKKERLWERLCRLYPRTRPSITSNMVEDDYTEVLLSHARMYVLGDLWGIENLQHVALQKLKEVLSRYKLYEQGPREIAQLIRYSFDHTVDKGEHRDPLRTLVSTYAACRVEELLDDDNFAELLGTVGDFPLSLMMILRDRLD